MLRAGPALRPRFQGVTEAAMLDLLFKAPTAASLAELGLE